MDVKEETEVVSFPRSVFETAETKEELEDWLLSQDEDIINKLRKAQLDDIQGKGVDWKSLKKDLCIK
ncbi:MAG: hypothetical protein HQK92_07990 [Nitrospirae bacterium]|nr:hypothetical protein [Nitrospirota bacterium]